MKLVRFGEYLIDPSFVAAVTNPEYIHNDYSPAMLKVRVVMNAGAMIEDLLDKSSHERLVRDIEVAKSGPSRGGAADPLVVQVVETVHITTDADDFLDVRTRGMEDR